MKKVVLSCCYLIAFSCFMSVKVSGQVTDPGGNPDGTYGNTEITMGDAEIFVPGIKNPKSDFENPLSSPLNQDSFIGYLLQYMPANMANEVREYVAADLINYQSGGKRKNMYP